MHTHYNLNIRLIAFLVVFAFILTQAGLGMAMPTRHAENLRPTSENPEVAKAVGDMFGKAEMTDTHARADGGGAGMNGAIKADLDQLADEINGDENLKQSFIESIDLMEKKDDEGKKKVPWHGFSHSGGNTAIALKSMLKIPGVPAEAMYLVGIAGMPHDIGYYLPDYAREPIKLGHEERGRLFVLNEAQDHEISLTDEQKAIVNLVISMTEMSIGADYWVGLLKAVRSNDAAATKDIIDKKELAVPEKLYDNWQRWQPVLEYALLGGMILAYLDIHDPRPDAAPLKTVLHEEFEHDINILNSKGVLLTEAEQKELNALKGMYKETLAEQLQDTHAFLNSDFCRARLNAFGSVIFEYIPEDAKRNMAITAQVASEVNSRLEAGQEVTDSDIEKLLESIRSAEFTILVLAQNGFSARLQIQKLLDEGYAPPSGEPISMDNIRFYQLPDGWTQADIEREAQGAQYVIFNVDGIALKQNLTSALRSLSKPFAEVKEGNWEAALDSV